MKPLDCWKEMYYEEKQRVENLEQKIAELKELNRVKSLKIQSYELQTRG